MKYPIILSIIIAGVLLCSFANASLSPAVNPLIKSNYTYAVVGNQTYTFWCLGVSENHCGAPLTIGCEYQIFTGTCDISITAKTEHQYSGYSFQHVDSKTHTVRSDFIITNGENYTMFARETQNGPITLWYCDPLNKCWIRSSSTGNYNLMNP